MTKDTSNFKLIKIMLVITLLISLSITVFAERLPRMDGQSKNNWCWAASAKKVGTHNGGSMLSNTAAETLVYDDGLHSYQGVPFYGIDDDGNATANLAQRRIVVNRKGNDADSDGNDGDKEAALQFISSRTCTIGTFGTAKTQLSSSQINTIRSDLNNGKYCIGNMTYSGSSRGGHSIVLLSYNASNGYYIYDPWSDSHSYCSAEDLFYNYGFYTGSKYGRVEWIPYCR